MKKRVIYLGFLFYCYLFNSHHLLAQATNKIDTIGHIGIGTTGPSNLLHVQDASSGGKIDGLFIKNGASVASGNIARITMSPQANMVLSDAPAYIQAKSYDITNIDLSLGVFGHADMLWLDHRGHIGIGTTSPDNLLHIEKSSSGGQVDGLFVKNSASVASGNIARITLSPQSNMALSDAPAYIQAKSYDLTNIDLSLGVFGHADLLWLNHTGKIGIGTTNPNEVLEVNGNISVPSTGSSIKFGSNRALYRDGGALYMGEIDGSMPVKIRSGGNDAISVEANGNVGIGTTSTGDKLSIAGNVVATGNISTTGNISAFGFIKTKKLTVTQTDWPDYVFDQKYKLRTLSSLEAFINQNKHLPEMPSVREVEKNGINVGDNQALLLKKIEELTLYVLDLNKKNEQLTKRIKSIERNKK